MAPRRKQTAADRRREALADARRRNREARDPYHLPDLIYDGDGGQPLYLVRDDGALRRALDAEVYPPAPATSETADDLRARLGDDPAAWRAEWERVRARRADAARDADGYADGYTDDRDRPIVGSRLAVDANHELRDGRWYPTRRGLDELAAEEAERQRLATCAVASVREVADAMGWTFERARRAVDAIDPLVGTRIAGLTEQGFGAFVERLASRENHKGNPRFPAIAATSIQVGDRYGRLAIEGDAGIGPDGRRRVDARCDCGAVVTVRLDYARSGHTTSCGCAAREARERYAEGPPEILVSDATMHRAIARATGADDPDDD